MKKARLNQPGLLLKINSGGVLLSHAVTHVVPSALQGLTAEFRMGLAVICKNLGRAMRALGLLPREVDYAKIAIGNT